MRFLFIFLLLLPGSLSAETYQTPKGVKIPFGTVTIPAPSPTQKSSSKLNIEPDFIPYVVRLKNYYLQYNGQPLLLGKLSIVRGELHSVVLGMNPDAIGECHEKSHKIVIGWWENHGECQKEELITHEIGHCLFEMSHEWGGFMESQIHSEAECKLNVSSFREHFYKSAKKQVDWMKEQAKNRQDSDEE